MRRLATLLLALALCGCEAEVDRNRWERMNRSDRELYVRSLLGAEQVKESKGGNDRRHSKTAEEYVDAIDAAYARGETRTPAAIFESMAERRSAPPLPPASP